MSDSIDCQPLPFKTICNDCAFHINVEEAIQCIHPQNVECTRYRYTIGTEIQQIITEATL